MLRNRPAHGFTLIELLVVMAILATLLSLAAPRYFESVERAKEATLRTNLRVFREAIVTTARRQRLDQLEWVGQQFAQAFGSYYEAAPGHAKAYPRTLQDLLEDKRYSFVRRHLRRVYAKPFSGAADWELVMAPDGGVRGVRARVPVTGGAVLN